jgi:uncharacterized membrane protein YkoI
MNKLALAGSVITLSLIGGCNSADKHADRTTEEEIAAETVPAVVMDAFKLAYPDVTIEEVEKETYADGTVHYEFEFKGTDGNEHEVELNDMGEVLEDHP